MGDRMVSARRARRARLAAAATAATPPETRESTAQPEVEAPDMSADPVAEAPVIPAEPMAEVPVVRAGPAVDASVVRGDAVAVDVAVRTAESEVVRQDAQPREPALARSVRQSQLPRSADRSRLAWLSRVPRRVATAIAGNRGTALVWAAIAAVVLVGTLTATRGAVSRAVPGEGQEPAPAPAVLHDDYDTLPIGSSPGWDMSASPKDAGAAAIVPVPTSVDRSVRLSLGAAGQTVVGCRVFPAVRRDVLLQAVVTLDGFGAADATVMSVRAGSSEIAALRIGSNGEVRAAATPAGARKGTSTVARNLWYDVAFDLDAASRMYSLMVNLHDRSELISDQPGVRWTGLLGDGIDRVCFIPPSGGSGHSLSISDLRVSSR
ncbi:MAG: hypothetical protein ABR525_09680 [Candidatus Limnocylindria bacterium]